MSRITLISITLLLAINAVYAGGKCQCGLSFANRVYDGKDSLRYQFPWIAHLRFFDGDNSYRQCVGVLLDRNTILTAGHCMCDRSGKKYVIKDGWADAILGAYNKSLPFGQGVKLKDYVSPYRCSSKNLDYDFAIVLVDRVRYEAEVSPICVPADIPPNTNFILAGRGEVDKSGTHSDVVRQTDVDLSHGCGAVVPPKGAICGTGVSKNKDRSVSCSGDDGAPIMYQQDGFWYCRGIAFASAAKYCGEQGKPDFYIPIEKVRGFLDNYADGICVQ